MQGTAEVVGILTPDAQMYAVPLSRIPYPVLNAHTLPILLPCYTPTAILYPSSDRSVSLTVPGLVFSVSFQWHHDPPMSARPDVVPC